MVRGAHLWKTTASTVMAASRRKAKAPRMDPITKESLSGSWADSSPEEPVAQDHRRSRPHMNVHPPTLTHTYPHPLTHIHPHTPTFTHTHPHSLTLTHTHPYPPTPTTPTHTYPLTHTHPLTHPHSPTTTHTPTHTPIHIPTHTPILTHTHPHLPTPTHTHPHPPTPIPTPTHTHLHTPTEPKMGVQPGTPLTAFGLQGPGLSSLPLVPSVQASSHLEAASGNRPCLQRGHGLQLSEPEPGSHRCGRGSAVSRLLCWSRWSG